MSHVVGRGELRSTNPEREVEVHGMMSMATNLRPREILAA